MFWLSVRQNSCMAWRLILHDQQMNKESTIVLSLNEIISRIKKCQLPSYYSMHCAFYSTESANQWIRCILMRCYSTISTRFLYWNMPRDTWSYVSYAILNELSNIFINYIFFNLLSSSFPLMSYFSDAQFLVNWNRVTKWRKWDFFLFI